MRKPATKTPTKCAQTLVPTVKPGLPDYVQAKPLKPIVKKPEVSGKNAGSDTTSSLQRHGEQAQAGH